jgi:hypothetical protein
VEAESVAPDSVGAVPKTRAPLPVSSEIDEERSEDAPVEVRSPPVVVKTAREAVRPLKVIEPDEVRPVSDESDPVMVELPVAVNPPEEIVSVVGVVMAPAEEIVVVAVPPKYAVPVLENSVDEALVNDWRPVHAFALVRLSDSVVAEPPMRAPSVPDEVMEPFTASEVVATFASPDALVKYGMLLMTPAVVVARPEYVIVIGDAPKTTGVALVVNGPVNVSVVVAAPAPPAT